MLAGTSEAAGQAKVLPAVWNLGKIRWPIAVAVALVWLVNWTITYRGIQRGIERAVKVMMPVLIKQSVKAIQLALQAALPTRELQILSPIRGTSETARLPSELIFHCPTSTPTTGHLR